MKRAYVGRPPLPHGIKKDILLNFKMSLPEYAEFKEACRQNEEGMSLVLRTFCAAYASIVRDTDFAEGKKRLKIFQLLDMGRN